MSLWTTLLKLMIEPIIVHLPAFVLRRQYSENKLEAGFEVDLRSSGGLAVLNTSVPSVAGNLRVTNFLPFDVTLDRCNFELWFGQPNVNISLMESVIVPARSSKDVFFKAQLADNQFEQAKRALDHPDYGGVHIYGIAECNVRFVKFKKRFNVERSHHELAAIARYRSAPTFDGSAAQPVSSSN